MYLCLSYVSCCCWSWFLSVCICSLCAFSPIIFCLFAYVAQASFVLLLTHWNHVILYLHLKEKLRNQIWSYALLKPTTFELHSLSPKALINIYFYFHAFFSLHLRWVFFFFPSHWQWESSLQHQWKILFQQPDSGVHLFCVTCCTSVSHMATCSVNLALVAYHN